MKIVTKFGMAAMGLIAMTSGWPRVARADAIPYPHKGTPNAITYSFTAAANGDIMAYFAGSSASYDEQLGMLDNGVLTSSGFGLDDHTSSVGQAFDLGSVKAGDTLVFVLHVITPSFGYVYSDPTMNTAYDTNGSVGHNHIYSTAYTGISPILTGVPPGIFVGFEDLKFPSSDFNYADETYVFTDVQATPSVPEPASLWPFAMGLLSIGLVGRRYRQA
jgi:hypothetical protein